MIGIIYATDAEAAPFLAQLTARRIKDRVMTLYRAESQSENTPLLVAVSGMGKISAALTTLRLIDHYHCRRIVHAGICGALTNNDEIHASAVLRIRSAVEKNTAAPQNSPQPVACDETWWPQLHPAAIVTVDQPVFDVQKRAALARLGQLVDMEAAAVARVSTLFDVPCVIIKGVSDLADRNGREMLKANIAGVSQKVADQLLAEIKKQTATSQRPQPAPADAWQKLLRFTKIEHTAFSLPLLFAGAWLGGNGHFPPIGIMLLIVIAAAGARIFGMSLNRIFDRRLDAQNPRTSARELPTGALSVQSALLIAGGGLAVYLAACTVLGGWCLILSPVPLVFLLGYSLLKRFTSLCHFGIGMCLAIAPLCAFVAAAGDPWFSAPVLVFALFVLCWMSGADIIYALMDIDSDRRNGVHSLPAVLGAGRATEVAGMLHIIAAVCILMVAALTGAGPAALVSLAVAAAALGLMYLPSIPLPQRFFPISTLAGVAAALVPMLGTLGGA